MVILVLAAIGDGISGNPIHCLLLLGAAIALGREAMLGRAGEVLPAPASAAADREGSAALRITGLLFILVFALLVGGFGRYSWPTTVAVLIPGAAALAVSWRGPLGAGPIRVRSTRWARSRGRACSSDWACGS